ncbi:MAG: hypothetical protein WC707_01190 [Candidatus Babeliaceae bacterium]
MKKIIKKFMIIGLFLIINQTACRDFTFTIHIPSMQTHATEQDRKKITAWKSFIKQYVVAYAIHYCGQTFTHVVLENNRHLAESPLALLLLAAQAYTSFSISQNAQEAIGNKDHLPAYDWANFWGFVSACYSKKIHC